MVARWRCVRVCAVCWLTWHSRAQNSQGESENRDAISMISNDHDGDIPPWSRSDRQRVIHSANFSSHRLFTWPLCARVLRIHSPIYRPIVCSIFSLAKRYLISHVDSLSISSLREWQRNVYLRILFDLHFALRVWLLSQLGDEPLARKSPEWRPISGAIN